jgi:hypothetical protein
MALLGTVRRAFPARTATLAAVALLTTSGAAAPGAPAAATDAGHGVIAAASVADVQCAAGAHGERFDPGLRLTSTSNVLLTGTGIITQCSTPPGSHAPDPLLTYATFTFASSTNTISCGAGSGTARFSFRWNDSGTSDATLTVTVNTTPGVGSTFVAQGPVTSGRFAGSVVVATFTLFTGTPQQCASPPGLQYTSGTMPNSTFAHPGGP